MASTVQTQQFLPAGTIHQVSPTVTANVITTNGPVTSYNRKAGKTLGIIILVCAIIVVSSEVVQLAVPRDPFPVGAGLWAGALYLSTGILGIQSGKRASRCAIIAYMALAIISACAAIPAFSMHVVGATAYQPCYRYYYYDYYKYDTNSTDPGVRSGRDSHSDCRATMTAVAILMSISSLTAFVCCIVASAFCCRAVCGGGCCGDGGSTRTVVVYYNSGPADGSAHAPVYVPNVGLVPPPPNTGVVTPQALGGPADYQPPPPYAPSTQPSVSEKPPVP